MSTYIYPQVYNGAQRIAFMDSGTHPFDHSKPITKNFNPLSIFYTHLHPPFPIVGLMFAYGKRTQQHQKV